MTKAQQFQYILEPRNETGGSRVYLDCGAHVLGRSDDADVVLDHDGISRTHCRITVFPDGGVSIEDLGSTNGTFVDDKPVQSCALEGPCELALGKTRYSLQPQYAADLALLGSGKMPGSPRPSQPLSPKHKTLRPNAEISMWEQVVRCWPQSTQGEDAYVPVLTALQQSLQASGLQLRDRDSTHILAQCGGTPEDPQMLAQSDRLQLWGWDVAQLATSLPKLLASLPAPTSAVPDNPAAECESDIVGPGIGTSNPKLLDAYRKLAKVAASNLSILITGQSGAGKEWVARWIHERSGLPQDRFIVINCAAIPTDLLESELFGIQKGVATGVSEREGVFARADGGTLFLDEIGEMPEALQAKVLRALDSGEIFPVGAGNAKKVQVRIVSATNRDLQAAIAEGRFRQDLYHRLAAHHIALPTLAQRSEDIPTLVSTFYQQAVRDTDKNSPGITTRAMATLMQFHWPGNIRQLKFAMQRAVQLLEPGEPLDVPHLPDELQPKTQSAADLALKSQLHRAEAAALRAALNATAGDIHQAGTLLDISRSSLYQKLKEHQIKPASPHQED